MSRLNEAEYGPQLQSEPGVNWRRILIGLLLAPLLVIVLFYWSSPYLWVVVISYVTVAYALAVLIGLPLHLMLMRYGVHEWRAYAMSGGAVALLPGIAFIFTGQSPLETLALNALFAAYGAPAGFVFWFIVRTKAR